jgi:hypothetical protein
MKATIVLFFAVITAVAGFGNGKASASSSRLATVHSVSQKQAVACESETPCGPSTLAVSSSVGVGMEEEAFAPPTCPPTFPCPALPSPSVLAVLGNVGAGMEQEAFAPPTCLPSMPCPLPFGGTLAVLGSVGSGMEQEAFAPPTCPSSFPCPALPSPSVSAVSGSVGGSEKEAFGPVCLPTQPCLPGSGGSPALRRFTAIATNVSKVDHQG